MSTRAKHREMAADIEAALRAVAERHDCVLVMRGGTFDPSGGPDVFKVELAPKKEDGSALDSRARDFQRRAFMHGLKADDLGRTFTDAKGDVIEIVGLRKGAAKYQIIGKRRADGQLYKFHAEFVRQRLAEGAK